MCVCVCFGWAGCGSLDPQGGKCDYFLSTPCRGDYRCQEKI